MFGIESNDKVEQRDHLTDTRTIYSSCHTDNENPDFASFHRPPVVIFVDSKVGADLLASAIHQKCDISTVSMHGDKSQEERTEALKSIQEKRCKAVVATGLLGRGLDLIHVTQVCNKIHLSDQQTTSRDTSIFKQLFPRSFTLTCHQP